MQSNHNERAFYLGEKISTRKFQKVKIISKSEPGSYHVLSLPPELPCSCHNVLKFSLASLRQIGACQRFCRSPIVGWGVLQACLTCEEHYAILRSHVHKGASLTNNTWCPHTLGAASILGLRNFKKLDCKSNCHHLLEKEFKCNQTNQDFF